MGREILNPRWWQRLRHSRGFGVHSPFAFRFITEVLNPPRGYRYYAEDTSRTDDERILARLKGFFAPARIHFAGRRAEALRAKGEASTEISEAELIVVDLANGCPAAIQARLERGGCVVLAFNHGRGRRLAPLLQTMTRGMSFINASSRAVIVADTRLPRQDFRVRW